MSMCMQWGSGVRWIIIKIRRCEKEICFMTLLLGVRRLLLQVVSIGYTGELDPDLKTIRPVPRTLTSF